MKEKRVDKRELEAQTINKMDERDYCTIGRDKF